MFYIKLKKLKNIYIENSFSLDPINNMTGVIGKAAFISNITFKTSNKYFSSKLRCNNK